MTLCSLFPHSDPPLLMFHVALIACESAWLPRWFTSLQSFLIQTAALRSVSNTLLHFLHSRLTQDTHTHILEEHRRYRRGQNFNEGSANQDKCLWLHLQCRLLHRWMRRAAGQQGCNEDMKLILIVYLFAALLLLFYFILFCILVLQRGSRQMMKSEYKC